jgi:hypothetical protein
VVRFLRRFAIDVVGRVIFGNAAITVKNTNFFKCITGVDKNMEEQPCFLLLLALASFPPLAKTGKPQTPS